MGRNTPAPAPSNTIVSTPIGGISPVFRSGDAYKAVGELVLRSIYTALSSAFPRNGSVSSFARTMPVSAVWKSIAYGAGVLVAVANLDGSSATTNIAAVSYDAGSSWYQTTLPATKQWSQVIFANGLFVAVAISSAVVATSPDGVHWTSQTIATGDWTSVAYGLGLFVAVASGGTVAASSVDGITWTPRTLPVSNTWNSVVFNGTVFIANISSTSTSAASSANGTTWTARTMPSSAAWLKAATNPTTGLTVAITGSGDVATTPDGVTWSLQATIGETNSFVGICFGNGVFIAFRSATTVFFTSSDGVTWVRRTGLNNTNNITYAAGLFMVFQSASTVASIMYAENLTDSDYLYLSGTAGQFVRVK